MIRIVSNRENIIHIMYDETSLGDRSIFSETPHAFLAYSPSMKHMWHCCREIVLRWMPHNHKNERSSLIRLMAWYSQTTRHYPGQCLPGSMVSQWVNWTPTFDLYAPVSGACFTHSAIVRGPVQFNHTWQKEAKDISVTYVTDQCSDKTSDNQSITKSRNITF